MHEEKKRKESLIDFKSPNHQKLYSSHFKIHKSKEMNAYTIQKQQQIS